MTPALALARGTTSQSDWETNRMPASRLKFESLPHAIFLQRVSGPLGATSTEARLGQVESQAVLRLAVVSQLRDQAPVSRCRWRQHGRVCRILDLLSTLWSDM